MINTMIIASKERGGQKYAYRYYKNKTKFDQN